MKRSIIILLNLIFAFAWLSSSQALAKNGTIHDYIYDPGTLKPVDSQLKVASGQQAPDFTLRSIAGHTISLNQYKGKKNVVLSFVPAAWTPVCSDQWPGYNISKSYFDKNDAILLGITVDNLPTQNAWVKQMGGLWFPVLSDFWPHGEVAAAYGILRSDGTSERALFFINKEGIVSDIIVSDINVRPRLEDVVNKLGAMRGK